MLPQRAEGGGCLEIHRRFVEAQRLGVLKATDALPAASSTASNDNTGPE